MSTIDKYTIKKHSFFKDSDEKKFVVAPTMPKYLYYTYAFSRNVIELTTTPGSMKDTLCMSWMVFCGGFGYCLIVFWFPGFLIGLVKIENDVRYYFLIWIFLYFLLATIGATGWTVTSRFRIAMLPSISVISSAGWFKIRSWYLNRNSKTPVY